MEFNTYQYVMFLCIIGICFYIYTSMDSYNLRCIISDVDKKTYCVRENSKMELAADLLAKTTQKMKQLVEYLKEKYPDRDNCKRLCDGFNPAKVMEILPTSKHVAYSENKGEKLAFCLTKEKNGTQLIDEDTLTFVAIHELAHIATKSVGHNDEYWGNFKFLLIEAEKLGIYSPQDYKKQNKKYCGVNITDNPYYDFHK